MKRRARSAGNAAAVAVNRAARVAAPNPGALLAEVRELILETRQTMARGVNSALVLLYWRIGQRIRTDVLKEQRAGYGENIFYALSRKLTGEFGNGFSQANAQLAN